MTALLGVLLLNACKKESTETPEPTNGQRITLTKAAGDNTDWKIWVDAADADRAGAWIDLNNNGKKDNGEGITKFGFGIENWDPFSSGASKTIVIYGKITSLICDENHLTALDISNNTVLENLYCTNNKLKVLDISKNKALIELYCNDNQLTSLDFTNNSNILKIRAWKNNIKGDNMKQFVNSLPSRADFFFRGIAGVLSNLNGKDGNSWPADADMTGADAKNWYLYEWKGE